MLNERICETERFATAAAPTVTVSPELLVAAANDGLDRPANIGLSQPRRVRRRPLSVSSPVGGWKVRMW